MTETAMDGGAHPKAPWHLWMAGILALLWNASGAYTIFSAQAGRLPGLSPDEAAYYAAQAPWFVAVTDIALLSAIAGAIALLLRNRWAVWLFALSLAAVLCTGIYDLAAGTSRMLANQGAMIVTIFIWVLAALQLAYSWWMRNRGVLR